MTDMNKFKALALETRAPFLTVTIVPVVLGAVMASAEGAGFDAGYFALILSGFICLHLGTNILNDYFDDKNGTDRENKEFIFPFTGGSRLIQSGLLKPGDVLAEGIVFFAAGTILIGASAVMLNSIFIAAALIFALVSGIFYTAPPFKWAHRGLGELLIALNFGPLMACVSYYAQAGSVSSAVIAASVIPGLLAAAIVDINEFPDFNADRDTGKKNLVVRLGREKGRYLYYGITGGAYLWCAGSIAAGLLHPVFLAALIGLPFTVKAASVLWKNFNSPKELAPACVLTILAHLISGTAVILGVILSNKA